MPCFKRDSEHLGEIPRGVTGMGIRSEVVANAEQNEIEGILLGGKDMIEE